MDKASIQKYQMVTRADDFGSAHLELFPKDTAAGEVVGLMRSGRLKLDGLVDSGETCNSAVEACAKAIRSSRRGLRSLLETLRKTYRAIGIDSFNLTAVHADPQLISSSRAIAEQVEPVKEQLSLHGLPAGFKEKLTAAAAALEEAIRNYKDAVAGRGKLTLEFHQTLDEALALVVRLDAIVSNTIGIVPAVQLAWDAARRVERDRGRKSPEVHEDNAAASATA